MTIKITIPARTWDKTPKFNFAVYSLRDGMDTIELESSFDSEVIAKLMFEREYSKWGLPDVRYYLVDWAKQGVIAQHVPEVQS